MCSETRPNAKPETVGGHYLTTHMETLIQFLDIDKFKVLRVVRVDGPDWNPFTGYVHYKRQFTKEYNSKTFDLLDNLIFDGIKQMYKNSVRYIDKDILFKGEYEDYLKIIKGGKSTKLTLRLTPQIPHDRIWDLVDKELKEYHLPLQFEILLLGNDIRLNHILDFGMINFPFDSKDIIARSLRTLEN